MQIITSFVGKIGFNVLGPSDKFNLEIKEKEIALCIAIDNNSVKPSIWLIGEITDIKEYLYIAKTREVIPILDFNHLMKTINQIANE